MNKTKPKQNASKKFQIGDSVMHCVPSMMYKKPGTITSYSGVRHKIHYWVVTHTNPKTKQVWNTPFSEDVLRKVTQNT